MTNLIELSDVVKTFKLSRPKVGSRPPSRWLRRETVPVRAVDGVSFALEAGELTGYIGPNGAGKSTTVKMLTGILTPSSGRVSVAGLDPVRDRIRLAHRIGVVFGQRTQLWWDLPLGESFELLRWVYRVPAQRHRTNLSEFVELLELEPLLATPVRQLSLGQRMRGDLVATLLHDPEILFLDEPTIGLDVVAKDRIRRFLLKLNAERGVTIVLTTHDMSDVERLCRRILIIDRGRILYDGGLDDFKERFGDSSLLVIDLEAPAPPIEIPGAVVERVDGPRQWLRFRRSELPAPDLIAAVSRRAKLIDLAIEEPAIEDLVRRVYERS